MMESKTELYANLIVETEKIKKSEIRDVTLGIVRNPKITFTRAESRINFLESPAAPKKHHAYPGGLLEHTWAVLIIAKNLAKIFEDTYNVKVEHDLVLASSVLHDIFKFYQYERDPITGGYRPRTDWYLSHEFAIIAELSYRGAPQTLIRCLAEMHGNVPTSMIESEIVRFADTVDAKFISRLQDIVWNSCRDVELLSDGKYIAQKIYPKVLFKKTIFELAHIYYGKGRDELTKYILDLLEKESLNCH